MQGNTYGVIIGTVVSLVAALYVYYGDAKGRCFHFVPIFLVIVTHEDLNLKKSLLHMY
jgi:hypothetical protein